MATAPQFLIPMARVKDVEASIAFYTQIGFHVRSTNVPPGQTHPTWAMLEGHSARLMVTSRGPPPVSDQQAVLFYIYYDDVGEAHRTATDLGLSPAPLCYPFYSPRGEFRLIDPDGYCLMVSST